MDYDRRPMLLRLLVIVAIAALWLSVFPVDRPFDRGDVFFEGIYLAAVLFTMMVVHRLSIPVLNAGWSMFFVGLLIDFLDEFTSEPNLIDTYIEGVLTAAGLLVIAYGVTRSIRVRERHERALERENERLDKVSSVISHDVRNPLSVAQGRIKLLAEESNSDHVHSIDRSLARIDAIIEDTLTLAQAGDSIDELDSADLAALTDTCWQQVETADATLATETERTIRADRSRVQQLLENLFRNAVEHGGEDVTVTVGSLEDGFYVADDGSGIPDDRCEQVFDAGYSTRDSGTGLGLNIVKEIADAHGWTISVADSEAGGALFEITNVEVVN